MVAAPSSWNVVPPADPGQASALALDLHIPTELATLLIQRGVNATQDAKTFLRPSLEHLTDPDEFRDLPEAVEIIAATVRRGDTILVHGDYDVDGQCATSILTRALRAADADVVPFVPHRMRDGYDLGPAGVREAERVGARLIVTCDCGTTAHEAIADAKRRGIQVVVTDHHVPTQLPPADAIVNPRRVDCASRSKELCGAGLAFKVVQGLVSALRLPENLPFHFLDYVALATVADLVPLTGENRTLVRYGLKSLRASRWPGIRGLVASAGLSGKNIRAGQVGFILAPRLNAVGRIGNAMDGVELLLCDDDRDAFRRAQALETINLRRQEIDQSILSQAIQEVEEQVDLPNIFGLVLARDGWHPGVIGIVASRLVETYARPTIMIGLDGDAGRGSGRSVRGFDLHNALSRCASHLLRFGGHRMAAGLSIARHQVDDFARAFNEAAHEDLTVDDLVRTQRVDAMVSVNRLDHHLEKLLRHFEPCGMGNPAPIFAVPHAWARGVRPVGDRHLRFTLEDPTGRLSAIGFGLATIVDTNWLEAPVDVAFRLEEDDWQGFSGLQARVVDLRPSR